MNCADFSDLLTAVVDGEATVLERARLERHLEACASCRRALRLARAMKGALASIPAPSMPADLRASLAREVLRRPLPRPRAFLTLAAAACLAAALLMLAGGDQEPEETIPVEAMLSVHQAYVRGGALGGYPLPQEKAREDADVL
jgi:anti-sigma factor RsiW